MLVSLIIGFLYYLLFRADALPWVLSALPWQLSSQPGGGIAALFHPSSSFPSWVHAFAGVLVINLLQLRATQLSLRYWLFVLAASMLVCEVFIGWFSWMDILAIVFGCIAAQILFVLLPPKSKAMQTGITLARVSMCVGVLGSSILAMGSYYGIGHLGGECARFDEQGLCEEYKQPGVPVYMSYERLRRAVEVQAARPPDRIGRMYLYQNFVFLNERNQGIHVIDNQIPSMPVNIGFIRVPGNTEIAIRGNYLYADSYVDLITLDLNDPTNVTLVGRQENIFPYDAFQNIPNNISFSNADTDPSNGVVVSYRLSGS